MTEDERKATQTIIEIDDERVDQAFWAAYCELGPEPPYHRRKAHMAYIDKLTSKAREICRRLI